MLHFEAVGHERVGVAGFHIEDQVFPKRCGHLEGKAVVPAEDLCAKIKAVRTRIAEADARIRATEARIAAAQGVNSGRILPPKSRTPLRKLLHPVRISARLGVQMEFVQKQLSKRMPSWAILSRLGVSLMRLP